MSQHEFVRAQDERIGAMVRQWSQEEQTARDLAELQEDTSAVEPNGAPAPQTEARRSWFQWFIDRFF